MSLFNFRRAGAATSTNVTSGTQTESVEVVRKRAKHRLIGSALLVLVGIVIFPLLFDTQPRPIAIDIPIEIPGKNAVQPLVPRAASNATELRAGETLPIIQAPQGPETVAAIVVSPAPATEKLAPSAGLSSKEEIVAEPKPASAVITQAPVIDVKPTPKVEPKATEIQPAALSKEGARAKALLEGRSVPSAVSSPPSSAPSESRLVVQVGAFADAAKAKEIRSKLEKAGLKTYTQLIQTPAGSRTRVRVGPFTNRADAEKAAGKIKTLDLPAAILTL
jgi:DedD protein